VRHDELHALHPGADHAVDRVSTAPAHADHLDLCIVLRFFIKLDSHFAVLLFVTHTSHSCSGSDVPAPGRVPALSSSIVSARPGRPRRSPHSPTQTCSEISNPRSFAGERSLPSLDAQLQLHPKFFVAIGLPRSARDSETSRSPDAPDHPMFHPRGPRQARF